MENAFVYLDGIRLPVRIRFPVELEPPPGFVPEDLSTWPRIDGRIEFVKGRLLYMPPCGDRQSTVATSLTGILLEYERSHPEFRCAGHEIGFRFQRETRGADGALVRKADVGPHTGGIHRVPPVLAIEISGRDEEEPELREKAGWYLSHGARVVWLLLPETREVVVLTTSGETRHRVGERLPTHPDLPGLEPDVDRFFDRLD